MCTYSRHPTYCYFVLLYQSTLSRSPLVPHATFVCRRISSKSFTTPNSRPVIIEQKMAAPKTSSLGNMNGAWIFHKGLSDSTNALLTLQGLPWWKRQVRAEPWLSFSNLAKNHKAAAVVAVTEHISQTEAQNNVARFDIELRITGGFKGGKEWLVLDGSEETMNHVNLGPVKNVCTWSDLSDVDDEWLKEGWLDEEPAGPNGERYLKISVKSEQGGWHLTNIWGFIEIEGERYHARKLLCQKGEETARCRAIYGWVEK